MSWNREKKHIYLDNSATTSVDPRVLEVMLPYFSEKFANPSGMYGAAKGCNRAMIQARRQIAKILNCFPHEIVFTSCGTESDNLAIRGAAWKAKLAGKGNHIITSGIEHSAVSKTIDHLCEFFGFEQTRVAVDQYGWVNPESVAEAIRKETILISIMYANNEVGTIEPLAEIGKIAREHKIPFHTDAVQAGGYLDLDVNSLNVDLMSLSGHKLNAPKGVGLLFVANGISLLPQQTGGGHEEGVRGGTENVPYVVGFAKALSLVDEEKEKRNAELLILREQLIQGVLSSIPGSCLTGHPQKRLPGHASFVFSGVDADGLLMRLDIEGICASSGSACNTGMPTPSRVLLGMGVTPEEALGAIRFSLGHNTTKDDLEKVLAILPEMVEGIRTIKV